MKALRTIKAVPNYGKRTFTLYVQYEGKTISKYRTMRYTQIVFDQMLYFTNEDWENYLRRADEYTNIPLK